MSAIVVFLIVLTAMLGAAIVAAAIASGVLLAREIRAARPDEARAKAPPDADGAVRRRNTGRRTFPRP